MRGVVCIIGLGCLLAGEVSAATLTVRQDGSGDYTTIGSALDAAADLDIIRVGPGIYAEALTIAKSVTLTSEAGGAATILDGRDSRRILVVQGPHQVSIQGFTLTHARADEGSALLAWQRADVRLENCIVSENKATGSNAVHVRHPGSTLRISNVLFLGNAASVYSGALSSSMGANLYVSGSKFIGNRSNGHGAVNVYGSYVEITGCLFLRNVGSSVGALTTEYSSGFVTGNTFHANSGESCSVRLFDDVTFTKNIISGEIHGYGLEAPDGTTHSCNLFHGNRRGPAAYGLGEAESVADPLYCDPSAEQLLICPDSPARNSMNGCGDMGALGVGCTCGPVDVETTIWGDLKSNFR